MSDRVLPTTSTITIRPTNKEEFIANLPSEPSLKYTRTNRHRPNRRCGAQSAAQSVTSICLRMRPIFWEARVSGATTDCLRRRLISWLASVIWAAILWGPHRVLWGLARSGFGSTTTQQAHTVQTALPSRVPGPWVPLTHYSQSSELKFVPEHSTIFEFQWNFLLVEYSCGAKRSVQRNGGGFLISGVEALGSSYCARRWRAATRFGNRAHGLSLHCQWWVKLMGGQQWRRVTFRKLKEPHANRYSQTGLSAFR